MSVFGFTVYGDRTQQRDFAYVNDIARRERGRRVWNGAPCARQWLTPRRKPS